ncbi:hypothetical protein [Silicimonas sp. MF1-12-2]|uniref:hypothetical protein n=1 Tax=Silicimonas sp. MF1-12-2 TaxID=3384793 RepID=UPI0039B6C742
METQREDQAFTAQTRTDEMIRMTDKIRNRRMPRQDAEAARSMEDKLDRSRARDIARLYTPRIWL